ncbi:dihydrodipicolinate synthase family protein [Jannaschia seohaensis]|uniref:4-hydroxy-tetrahydrodipicolinate synthase n=1 Tax=Jannaschia seohaensis TaxID=475081 RepID=A0A2Y9A9X0_9RHOB|nr:dihydrodipicolinate synthase family protein [Jannaschia seohaensis]PWJ20914.1 4-hydroxy-tetrahydrodipicolinate synthase [Jannaschia seohaensis]SSA41324.1 4-hydroxy-tetrahydrodipicolinate synthase [Jannaschia seohaensis]
MAALIDRQSSGVFIIAATPFTDDGALDLESADRMVDFYLECGVSGMTILGIMGEAPKLAPDESMTFARHVLDRVAGRVPVIVGVSAAGLDNMARLTGAVMEAGAGGVMVAPQPGLLTDPKLKGYIAQVCAALGPDVPICFQDYPQTTGVQVSVETIIDLTVKHPQIVMLKHEDWPGLTKLSRVRAETGVGDVPRMSILTGNSALFLAQEMQRGADGAMTGFAYPEMLVQVVARHRAGDVDGAEDLFDAYLPMVRYEQQLGLGLAIRKEVLRRRGVLASAKVRAPGPSLTDRDHEELSRLMARLDKRLGELS